MDGCCVISGAGDGNAVGADSVFAGLVPEDAAGEADGITGGAGTGREDVADEPECAPCVSAARAGVVRVCVARASVARPGIARTGIVKSGVVRLVKRRRPQSGEVRKTLLLNGILSDFCARCVF
ncbi:hypothetical protein AA0473_1647 [Acetobacter orleanensis NRIC 0473]|nr:hypothetical protein AA0473_1647 [Acetobacter orleanensis NRIC 0473]